nr:hypothetical protein HK105_005954 [Polyrhizophydium stewartii]
MFDGADVVPMDVDEADRQRLLSDLEAYRRDHKDDAGPEPPAQAPHKTAVVVDTNFLIANLSLLRKTVDVMPSDMFIMVPLTVLRELDGLKVCFNHDDIKGRLRVSLGDCARQANLFLHKVFSSNSPLFRGQSVSDVREGAEQTGSPFSVMHSSAPSDAFHGGDGGMDVDPDDSEHATYPVPLEPPPQVQLAESRQAAALSQLEMTFYGCMHACIPVLLQKAFGDKWQERSGARDPPADVAGQISLIEQHSAEFQGLISRDVLSSLGQARRMAMDLRRSVRQNKVMLTRGDLALFLRDAESLMLESCRVCRFVESEARVRREMQAVRNELGAGLA